MKENKYSEKVTKYLKETGALVDNNTASIYARVGRSDLTALYKGYYLALELKTGSYQPTDLQIRYLQKVRDNGGIGLILRDNLDLIKKVVYAIYNGLPIEQPKLPELSNDIGLIFD